MSAALLLLLQLASYAAPAAVDHVATMEVHAYSDDPAASRSTVYRSGRHMRVESQDPFRSESDYTNVESGLTTTVLRDSAGVVQRVTIGPPVFRNRRLPPTARSDRVLGQGCTIWRLRTEHQDSGAEICETSDGILLRHSFWYPPGNRTVLYMQATAVERRLVRPEEVLPPRDLLALAAAPPPAGTAPAVETPDHEVEMVGDDPADGSYVLRHHGPYSSDMRRNERGRSLTVRHGSVSISFREDESGRPVSLEVDRGYGPGVRRLRIVSRWEALPGRAAEQVLSETCTWQENTAIQGTDTHHECRTADGITLRTESWFHWTNHTERFTARRLSRRLLSDADFAPPARALDWATWGITPAP